MTNWMLQITAPHQILRLDRKSPDVRGGVVGNLSINETEEMFGTFNPEVKMRKEDKYLGTTFC